MENSVVIYRNQYNIMDFLFLLIIFIIISVFIISFIYIIYKINKIQHIDTDLNCMYKILENNKQYDIEIKNIKNIINNINKDIEIIKNKINIDNENNNNIINKINQYDIEKYNETIEKLNKNFDIISNRIELNDNKINEFKSIYDNLNNKINQYDIEKLNENVEKLNENVNIISDKIDLNDDKLNSINCSINEYQSFYNNSEINKNYSSIDVFYKKCKDNLDIIDYYDFLYKYYSQFKDLCKTLLNTTKSEAVNKFNQGTFRQDNYINKYMFNYILFKLQLDIKEVIIINSTSDFSAMLHSSSFIFKPRKDNKLYNFVNNTELNYNSEEIIEKSSLGKVLQSNYVNSNYFISYKIIE